MAHKKKYLIGSYILSLILFVLLLGVSSTCYARTTLTEDEAKYICDYLFTNTYTEVNNYNVTNFYAGNSSSYSKLNNDISNSFRTFFNNNNTIDIDTGTTVFWLRQNSNITYQIFYGNFNNSKPNGNNLPFLYLEFDVDNNIKFYAIDDNKNKVDFSLDIIEVYNYSNNLTFNYSPNNNYGPSYNSLGTQAKYSFYNWNSQYYDNSSVVLDCVPGLVTFNSTNAIYSNWNGKSYFNTPIAFMIKSLYDGGNIPTPEPPIPEDTGNTGQITDDNGDVTGNIDLTGIQNSLGNIDNTTTQIEQNTQTIIEQQQQLNDNLTSQPDLSQTEITEEQIEDAVDFDFMADPYANFWLQMTTGLSGALTNTVRQIPVDWLGYQGVFDLDELGFNYPAPVRLFLTSASTISMVWVLVRWWKIIVDKLTSGNMDEVLAMNEEERYYRFILRGCKND